MPSQAPDISGDNVLLHYSEAVATSFQQNSLLASTIDDSIFSAQDAGKDDVRRAGNVLPGSSVEAP